MNINSFKDNNGKMWVEADLLLNVIERTGKLLNDQRYALTHKEALAEQDVNKRVEGFKNWSEGVKAILNAGKQFPCETSK